MNRGFSLLELSVVLVIIGLLAGGVTVGRSLVASAELRAVYAEYDAYMTAIQSFRNKYRALPGDLRNAIDYWGAQHADHATCIVTASTSQATCNGNGDGEVGDGSSLGTENSERFRAWQHLANAGLVSGTFSGVAGSAGPIQSVTGVNVPASKKPGVGWTFLYQPAITDDAATNRFLRKEGHYLLLGTNSSVNRETIEPNFTAEEALTIDTKIDDGRPGMGAVHARKNLTTCFLNGASAFTATYNIPNTAPACAMSFDAF